MGVTAVIESLYDEKKIRTFPSSLGAKGTNILFKRVAKYVVTDSSVKGINRSGMRCTTKLKG
jgi:hypothetical protein